MDFETEFDDISPFPESYSVSDDIVADDSLLISTDGSGEGEDSAPDAIINDVENWDDVQPESISFEPFPDSLPGQETVQGENQTEKVVNETDSSKDETLSSIYKLLDERIPERSESEPETILESEIETEKTLSDLFDELDSIKNYESEQSGILSEIRNNNIISNNNDYYMDSFQIALMSAIFGSILVFLLFRNIR